MDLWFRALGLGVQGDRIMFKDSCFQEWRCWGRGEGVSSNGKVDGRGKER